MAKKLKTYEVLVKALENFSLVNLDINVLNKKGENVFKKVKESAAEGLPVPYLSFIEENKSPFTLRPENTYKNWDGILEYSTDTENWSEWDGTEISSSNNGELYLRGTGNTVITNGTGGRFALTENKSIKCIGNIENLLDYKTVKAGNHPVMAESCYAYMFYYCSSITQAPELPATTLAINCYAFMFCCCDSLTVAPKLPATTLAINCYNYMFSGCSSLTKAPELPATTLAVQCYSGMFENCTALTVAPELPATTLADYCYSGMFSGCSNLTGQIHCASSTASDSYKLTANDISGSSATVVYDL